MILLFQMSFYQAPLSLLAPLADPVASSAHRPPSPIILAGYDLRKSPGFRLDP